MIARRTRWLATLGIALALSGGVMSQAHEDAEGTSPVALLQVPGSDDDVAGTLDQIRKAWNGTRVVTLVEPPSLAKPIDGLDCDQVIDALDLKDGERAHLVGRGLGGVMAFHVALKHPDRIRSVCVVDGVADLGLEGGMRAIQLPDEGLKALKVPSAIFVGAESNVEQMIAQSFVSRIAHSRIVSIDGDILGPKFGDERLSDALRTFIDESEQFESVFDGLTLDGWRGDERFWSVQDGEIVGKTTPDNRAPHNTFLILDGDPVDDFELRVEIMMTGNNNSGIQYRSTVSPDYRVTGYQCDIHPNPPYCGMLYEEGGRGIACQQGQQVRLVSGGAPIPMRPAAEPRAFDLTEWNEFVVIAKGSRLEHQINGHTTVTVDDSDEAKRSRSGVIAFQIHAGQPYEVRFRKVRLRRLPTSK